MMGRFVAVLLCAGPFTASASRAEGLHDGWDMGSQQNPQTETSQCIKITSLPKTWTFHRYFDLDFCGQGLYLYFEKSGNRPYLHGTGALSTDDILGVKNLKESDRVKLSYICNPKLSKLSVEKCYLPLPAIFIPTFPFPSVLTPDLFHLPRAKIAAIFLDYDGCGDIISPTNPKNANNGEYWDKALKSAGSSYNKLAGYLLDALGKIGKDRDRVILFVGSNRQSRQGDNENHEHNQNGLALGKDGGFELLEVKYKGKGWELNKALLADNGVPGSAWNDASKAYDWNRDELVKKELAENNFKQLQNLGPVDVFFIDDVKAYIDYARLHAKVPANIRFYTIHYDWYDYATKGLTDELVAEDVFGRKRLLWM